MIKDITKLFNLSELDFKFSFMRNYSVSYLYLAIPKIGLEIIFPSKKFKTPGEENCFNCKNLTQNKRKNYSCLFKKCQMGIKPFYPEKIPEDCKFQYGFEVCKFEKKQ